MIEGAGTFNAGEQESRVMPPLRLNSLRAEDSL
jgi:hypothetical protein